MDGERGKKIAIHEDEMDGGGWEEDVSGVSAD